PEAWGRLWERAARVRSLAEAVQRRQPRPQEREAEVRRLAALRQVAKRLPAAARARRHAPHLAAPQREAGSQVSLTEGRPVGRLPAAASAPALVEQSRSARGRARRSRWG